MSCQPWGRSDRTLRGDIRLWNVSCRTQATASCHPKRIQEHRSDHCRNLHVRGQRSDVCLPRELYRGLFYFFRGFGGEAVSPIIGDRSIDDRSAVDTFPGIEHQEEV